MFSNLPCSVRFVRIHEYKIPDAEYRDFYIRTVKVYRLTDIDKIQILNQNYNNGRVGENRGQTKQIK